MITYSKNDGKGIGRIRMTSAALKAFKRFWPELNLKGYYLREIHTLMDLRGIYY